jgi:hypothetical protein
MTVVMDGDESNMKETKSMKWKEMQRSKVGTVGRPAYKNKDLTQAAESSAEQFVVRCFNQASIVLLGRD